MVMSNNARILAFNSHSSSNQKFNFTPVEFSGSYIYAITTSYCDGFALDISGGSSDEDASLQIFTYNSTAAQKFMIKAVYDGEVFKGYVLLTGTTGYKKIKKDIVSYKAPRSFQFFQ